MRKLRREIVLKLGKANVSESLSAFLYRAVGLLVCDIEARFNGNFCSEVQVCSFVRLKAVA